MTASVSAPAATSGEGDVQPEPPAAPRRRPPQLDRLPALDGLRVLCAVGVVGFHLLGAFSAPNSPAGLLGTSAALTFLLISGFVISRPFLGAIRAGAPAPSAARFLLRRAVRILPLWWVVVATTLTVRGSEPLSTASDWALTLSLLQMLDADVRHAVVGPAWALSVIWIWYLLTPLVAAVLRRIVRSTGHRSSISTIGMAVYGAAALALFIPGATRPFSAFALGACFAAAETRVPPARRTTAVPRPLRSPVLLIVVTAAVWAVLLPYPYADGLAVEWLEQDVVLAALWLLVAVAWFVPVAFAAPSSPLCRRLSSPPIQRAAALTLGVYLWHGLVLDEVRDRLGADAHLLAATYLVALGTLVLAVSTRRGIEEPVARLLSRDARSVREPVAPPDRRSVRQIEGLRVAAAVAVVAFHVIAEETSSASLLRGAGALVIPTFTVFFTISGFVLYRPWAAALLRAASGEQVTGREVDGGIGRFLFRRACRLYPLYWAAQAIALVQADTAGISAVDWFQIVTLSPAPDYESVLTRGLGVMVWTLMADGIFYLLLPFFGRMVLAASGRTGRFWAVQLVPLGVLFLGTSVLTTRTWGFVGVFPCLLIGMALGAVDVWQRAHRRWLPGLRAVARSGWAVLPTIALLTVIGYQQSANTPLDEIFAPDFRDRLPMMVLASTILFIPAVFGPGRSGYRRVLGTRWSLSLGALTYGVYLWHIVVLRAVTERWQPGLFALLLLVLAGAAIFAQITNVVIEQPANRLGRSALRRPPADLEIR